MSKSCFIEDCYQYMENITSFHRFPTDPDLCNSWCQSIQMYNDQQNAFTFHRTSSVCGHHFRKSDKYFSGRRVMLYKNVVPSIFPRRIGNDNNTMEIETESVMSSSQDSSNDSSYSSTNQSDLIIKEEEDPLVEKDNLIEQRSCTFSECEDFYGFEADDLNEERVNASSGDIKNSENVDVCVVENKADPKDDDESTDDSRESDDEIIFVENNVEVIEIDDDDDIEIPQTTQIREGKKLSKYDIQQMVIANHPQVELRKPKLDWKSDQFRLVYINGETQNLCTCTKCYEIFEEINIDVVCRHAKCNPTPCVSPCTKRRKMIDQQGNTTAESPNDNLGPSIQNLSISKIQTIAACMDVEASTFYQGKRFLHFAQFLIDTGAKAASTNKNKFIFEPKYVLDSFRDQLRDSQLSKIASILNDPNIDFSLSCEVWEDNLRRKTNVSLDLHYLDKNFLRHRIVIGVRSINDIIVDDAKICDRILEILRSFSKTNNGAEFLQRAVAFITSRKFSTLSLGTATFPSACSIINDIADGIVNEDQLKIAEKCLHIIAWLNVVSTEKITVFDASKWENIFELFKRFNDRKTSYIQQVAETTVPQDYFILELLQPFHNAISELSESKNITKVFGTCKLLANNLLPLSCDTEIVKSLKNKALEKLRTAFVDTDAYQICMFLDPSNRDLYSSLESDQMDNLQSKVDAMINPYTSTKENACVENDLIDYMDDSVTSQQNQIDLFLQWLTPKNDPYEFWRDNEHMPGLKTLARKYFTIPTYASLSECKFSADAKDFLVKRSTLEMKNMEVMLVMNSSQFDVDRTNLS